MAIEIDGDGHAEEEKYDTRRTQKISSYGITIVRYTNRDIMENLDGVYLDLEEKIKQQEQKSLLSR